jgi:SAM-dependent methyltransferase
LIVTHRCRNAAGCSTRVADRARTSAAARKRVGVSGTLVGIDINHGRLRFIDRAQAATAAAGVTALPFPDAAFDVVLAMHMLYHVPDIPAAVAELRRVLHCDGVLYAFTNSETAQWELTELYLRHGGDNHKAMGDTRFSNESGSALLATAFSSQAIELIELRDSELVVTDPECIVDEFERLRYTLEPGLAPGALWETLIDGVRRDAITTIDADGAFRISENHGLFICSAEGPSVPADPDAAD